MYFISSSPVLSLESEFRLRTSRESLGVLYWDLPLSYPGPDTINFPNRQHFRHDSRSELDLLHPCLVAAGTLCWMKTH